jgi:hypothetical protein
MLLTSCQPHRQTTAKQLPPPPPPVQPPRKVLEEDSSVVTLREGVAFMRELTLQSDNALPDAMLNRTRCFILGRTDRAQGISSCRSASAPYSWSTPEMVTFRSRNPVSGNVLIFVLSEGASEALNSGTLDLAKVSVSPGKTVKEAALLTDRDLGHDLVTYRYSKPILSGTDLSNIEIKRVALQAPGAETPGGGVEPGTSRSSKIAGEYVDWVRSYFNAVTPTGIIIHHSGIIPSTNKIPTALKDVDDYHAERGLDIECFGREYHVAYHYLIFPSGRIQAGRPERCQGAHARGYNSYIGISLVGDFSPADDLSGGKGPSQPTRQQLKSLIQLTRQLRRRYNIPVQRILRHSDVSSTRCPGERFAFKSFLLALEQTTNSR